MKLIRSKELIINQAGAKIVPFLLPPEVNSFSVVEVQVDSSGHGMTKTTHADRILHFIKGEGVLTVDGTQSQVQHGAIYVVPKNSFYDYRSTTASALTVWVFDVPKYDPRYELSQG